MARARVPVQALLFRAVLCAVLCAAALALAAPARAGSFSLVKDRLTMPDGVELAVTYFMPSSASESNRRPVLLEMNPYRKDDMMFVWDYPIGAYFARHGFVVARVDVRGTGASGGVLPPAEYSEAELADGVAVIDLLSKKPFSNGKVGMYGLSWSAFNALMIAARKPPALRAILAAHVSDDLYYQDVHFIDGAFHMDVWEHMIDTFNALPAPDQYAITPEFLANRFDREPWHFLWKEKQGDGPYWRKESLRFRQPVDIPIYVIGGLLDGYRDTVARLMDTKNPNVKADLGPWTHDWPTTGNPGPNYEWRDKAVRWFGHWLAGEKTGIMEEPRFMVFVRDGYPAADAKAALPGEWRCGAWPLTGMQTRRLHPGQEHDLAVAAAAPAPREYSLEYWPGTGLGVHTWWGELSDNMADDDASSLVFDSEPLEAPVEIIGFPRVRLRTAADAPLYHYSVRLEDVFPDGSVSLVSGALINPADRDSRLERKPMVPGEPVTLSAEIHYTTWRFKPGHRIRLAVSNAQFPMAWPTPHKGSTTLFTGPDTWLELPVVAKSGLTARCTLPRPEAEEEGPAVRERDFKDFKTTTGYDQATGVATYSTGDEETVKLGDVSIRRHETNVFQVQDYEPAKATYKAASDYSVDLPGRSIHLDNRCEMRSDETDFNLTVTRRLTEDGTVVREKRWDRKIPRNLQ